MKAERISYWMILLWAVMFCSAIATEIYTVRIFIDAREVASWPQAQGVITRSEVQSEWRGAINGTQDHSALIEYEYKVEGVKLKSSGIRTRGVSARHKFDAENAVAKFPVGSPVLVYYHRDDPAVSYLESGVDWLNFVLIMSPPFFAFLFGTAVVAGIQQNRAIEIAEMQAFLRKENEMFEDSLKV